MNQEEMKLLPVVDLHLNSLTDIGNYMGSEHTYSDSGHHFARIVCRCESRLFDVLLLVSKSNQWNYETVVKCQACGLFYRIHEG